MDESQSEIIDDHADESREEQAGDELWRRFAYEQFMRDDDPEDAVDDDFQ